MQGKWRSGARRVEGKVKMKEKSIKVDYETWRILKVESLKRGKSVKRVLREILNEWGRQKEDLA